LLAVEEETSKGEWGQQEFTSLIKVGDTERGEALKTAVGVRKTTGQFDEGLLLLWVCRFKDGDLD